MLKNDLRARRTERGWTQAELAGRVGVSRKTINTVENNVFIPSTILALRLAQAMQIDKRYDGIDLCAAGPLWLGSAARRVGAIGSSTRIGLTREVNRKRRFFECGSPYVSGPRALST